MTTPPDQKIHSIQLLRFIAATLVVLFHAHLAIATHLMAGAGDYEKYLFGFGAVGVHIFFVISGYIMILTNSKPGKPFSASRFFQKRIIRIYPIYWLLAALYIIVNTISGSPYDMTPGSFFSALLLWPEHASLIIGPAWTLSYEMYFYFAFGIAMAFGFWRGVLLLSVAFFAAISAGIVFRPEGAAINLATNTLLIEFLFGVWIGCNTISSYSAVGRACIVLLVARAICRRYRLRLRTSAQRRDLGYPQCLPDFRCNRNGAAWTIRNYP